MNKLFFALFWGIVFNPLFGMTVLIDPGHGGEDKGASANILIGKKKIEVFEKDLALSMAKKIQFELNKKKISAFLTRSLDRTITLDERAQLADKLKADIYISVHLNASSKKEPRGFETYYLDNHNDGAIKKVEEAENKMLQGEDLIIQQILTDLVIGKTVETSKRLASFIHQKIYANVGQSHKMNDRGIKPGLFYVLALAKRPAVLLEVGFMSNQKEVNLILSEKFQNDYAKSVAEGVSQYISSKKNNSPPLF